MTQRFTIGQCVRIISPRGFSRIHSDDIVQKVKKYKGETGDILVILSNPSGEALDGLEQLTEDIYCEIELHKSKQIIRVPVEALEPC